MFYQASLFSLPNATSSPESESGATPCGKQDGPMTDQSGQEVALANHSAQQAKGKGLLTSGIYGQHSTGSSSSVNLMLFLASKLQAKTASLGSTLFGLTWKQRTTPSGRSICALRASALRTSGNACTSWPSPLAHKSSPQQRDDFTPNLAAVAQLTSWPTPRTVTGGAESAERKQELGRTESGGGDLQAAAMLASWATPQGRDHFLAHSAEYVAEKKAMGHGMQNLNDQATLASWATPTQRDHKDGNCSQQIEAGTVPINALLGRQAQLTDSGEMPSGSTAGTASGGQLNPALARWLMGLPSDWCEAAIRARRLMRTTRRKPARSGSEGTGMA